MEKEELIEFLLEANKAGFADANTNVIEQPDGAHEIIIKKDGWLFIDYWFSGFKRETGNLARYKDLAALHEAIAMQIYYYNHHRIHSALKMSPAAYAARLKQRDTVFVKRGG